MPVTKILNILIIVASILSAIFFLVLFSSVRCEADDMVAALPFRDKSFLEILHDRYYHESFRPVYPIITFFSLGFSSNSGFYPYSVFITYVFIWALFVFAIYKLLKEIFWLGKLTGNKFFLLLCFSQLLFTCVYFLTTAKVEVFGFISVGAIHLTPVVFIFMSAWLLIKKQNTKTDYLFLTVSTFFVAGGSDHIGAEVLAVLGIISILFILNKERREILKRNRALFSKIVFFGITLATFFILFVTNPGLWTHYHNAQSYTLQNPEMYHTHFFETLIMFCEPGKLIGLSFLIISWILFFKTFAIEIGIKIKLKYFVASFIVVVIVTALTGKLAYNSFMVSRVWFITDVALFVLLSAIIIKYEVAFKLSANLLPFGAGFIVLVMLLFNIRHIPKLLHFSKEFDAIITYLQKQESGKVIVLEKFPEPDLTSQAILSTDPNEDVNILFCDFYNIKAKVSVKK